MREIAAVLSALVVIGASLPYARDIIRGRAHPSRSTRLMYLILMVFALIQQHSLGSTLGLLLIAGEVAQSILIFAVAIKFGHGGFTRLDQWCYGLLALNLAVWSMTGNALLAIHVTIAADIVATVPTLVKTYRDPSSETPLYWCAGVLAAALAIFSETTPTYSTIVFPLYLLFANAAVVALAVRKVDARDSALGSKTAL